MSALMKSFRLRRKMTQKELGRLLNVSGAQISLIESGRASMSPGTAAAFNLLQQDPGVREPGGEGSAASELEAMGEKHLLDSNEYLRRHKRDRQLLLGKYERQLEQWSERYEKAIVSLQLAEQMMRQFIANDPNSPNIIACRFEQTAALVTLDQIRAQKPEITMVKIAGLKQELRSIKAMLGNKRAFLGMPTSHQLSAAPPPALE
ncbi:MAG: XRE family transcriptional regulator, partial [Sphingobacteriales bacterium]